MYSAANTSNHLSMQYANTNLVNMSLGSNYKSKTTTLFSRSLQYTEKVCTEHFI